MQHPTARRHSPTRRRARSVAVLLTLVAVASVLAGCQRGRVGARCRTTDWGDDGGSYVLQCRKGRWVRALTKADAARFLLSLNSRPAGGTPAGAVTGTPTPTTSPASPPPALTSFGAVDTVAVGRGSGQIVPGTYLTSPSGTGGICDIVRNTPAGDLLGRRFAYDGPLLFTIPEGDARITTTGPCTWRPAPGDAQTIPASGDGVYRVGVEIQPGRYVASGSDGLGCYWETATGADGSYGAITDNSFSDGPQMVEIVAGDRVFVSSKCGTWTPMPTLPASYFEIVGATDQVLDGHRAFYWGTELWGVIGTDRGVGDGWDYLQIHGQDWAFYLNGPQSARLHDGTYDYLGPWSTTQPRAILQTPGRSCYEVPGAIAVQNLHRDVAGELDGFDLAFIAHCGNDARVSFVRIHVAPGSMPHG